jgi:hypothetical protein
MGSRLTVTGKDLRVDLLITAKRLMRPGRRHRGGRALTRPHDWGYRRWPTCSVRDLGGGPSRDAAVPFRETGADPDRTEEFLTAII